MTDPGHVNPVELSPLILAECRVRVVRDLDPERTNLALVMGMDALYDAAAGSYPMNRELAEMWLRQLAAPLAGRASGVKWSDPALTRPIAHDLADHG